MSEQKQSQPIDLGIYGREGARREIGAGELTAVVLSVVWLAGSAAFFLFMPAAGAGADPLRLVMTLLAVFMPVALIWVAATAARSARIMREESARLQAAIDALRHAYLHQQQAGGTAKNAEVEKKLVQLERAQRQTETAITTFSSIRPAQAAARPAPEPVQPTEDQASLALGTPAEALAPPLSVADFIRAIHFPENPEDKEGFRALRRALQDRSTSGLVQAAQDVLTLLSQDGIYMDDLRPDRARPEVWRRFANGERGRAIASLGGVRDRSSLALTAGRMRKDTVFRDAVHHFLRKFDQTFARFEKEASDEDIAHMADTRTARAFMLLGRVAGTFD